MASLLGGIGAVSFNRENRISLQMFLRGAFFGAAAGIAVAVYIKVAENLEQESLNKAYWEQQSRTFDLGRSGGYW